MNDQQHDMTGAWALNALDAEERALLEEFLAQDPDAAAEARSFEETAGELAHGLAPQTPRPALKHALMAQISQTRQLSPEPDAGADSDVEPATSTESLAAVERDTAVHDALSPDATVIPLDRYRSRTRWLSVAAGALLVTSIAGFGLWGTERAAQQETRETLAALESAQADAEQENQMVSTIMASDDAAHLTVPSDQGGSLQLMYSREQQAMIVQGANLPDLPEGEVYQLWMIDGSGDIASAGLLDGPADAVMQEVAIPEGVTLGLTIEPAGGSVQPSMDPIASGVLT
ncbi:anti-sigma factor [uncultured Brachybacterium sp.]|uniref:anti-sigma factor n=1 Tax=uncultured Brachybacterium sp. TaxID=189680 RepID=UPI0026089A2E|nr:anti-sigma factor [uncultured Brachybacterium sp.]